MNSMIITTTNTIENSKIEKYFGVVTSNIVVGTNIFSDIAASFTDFFGGSSNSYQRKLQGIYKEAMDEIARKANILGANCVIGLHVDFDEISGKNKSMFMISAMGTAAYANIEIKEVEKENVDIISSEEFNTELIKREYIQKFKNQFPVEEEWEYLLSHNIPELAEILYDKYLYLNEYLSTNEILIKKYIKLYLNKLDSIKLFDLLYDEKRIKRSTNIATIKELKAFNYERILNLLKNNDQNIAASLLDAEKPFYTKDDILQFNDIINEFNKLPDLGRIEEIKGGILSRPSNKYICPNGHKNDINHEYCSECRLNTKGLNINSINAIERFKERLKILEEMFK